MFSGQPASSLGIPFKGDTKWRSSLSWRHGTVSIFRLVVVVILIFPQQKYCFSASKGLTMCFFWGGGGGEVSLFTNKGENIAGFTQFESLGKMGYAFQGLESVKTEWRLWKFGNFVVFRVLGENCYQSETALPKTEQQFKQKNLRCEIRTHFLPVFFDRVHWLQ